MSTQEEIEAAITTNLVASLAPTTITMYAGPVSQAQVEGDERAGAVWLTGGAAERLEFAQDEWRDVYAIAVFWSQTIDRTTRIDEWEAILAELRGDQFLEVNGIIATVADSRLASVDWLEFDDSATIVATATLEVRRLVNS